MRLQVRMKTRVYIALLLLVCLTGGLAGCGGSPASAEGDPQSDYNAAVADARTLSTAKISRNLTAVTASNANLFWENNTPGTRVLVATYVTSTTACSNYSDPTKAGCKVGQECLDYGFSSWVTVVPELKTLVGKTPTLLRVAQALGLPPPAPAQSLENTCIVELYVSPNDLFRPSPDPEITDREAELSIPTDGFRKFDDTKMVWSDMPCDSTYCATCTADNPSKCGRTTYKNWYNNRRTYVYDMNPAYPWTALGYTYDWGNPVAPHIGVSEFVINADREHKIPVFIKSVTWTGAYFAN